MSKPSIYLFLVSLFFTFSSINIYATCTPAGTAGDDSVTCTGVINSFQFLYGGSDTITLNNVSALAYNNSYWLDESLGGNPVTDGDDTFIAHYSQFYWVLGFGGNDTFLIDHSQFNNAYGDTNPGHGLSQRGEDTFTIEDSVSFGYILGGNDNDTITIKDSNVSNVASGYSNIYVGTDFTPFDGNDTIILDHVNFNAPLYWNNAAVKGLVASGRGDDIVTFKNTGEAYYVYLGHGNDTMEVFDHEHFNACDFSTLTTDRCGIYADEPYASELNASLTPQLHGNDKILLHDGDLRGIFIQGGDGSDLLSIETPVVLDGNTELNGGDDLSVADTFIDTLQFDQWTGEINSSRLFNWEQIVLDNASDLTFRGTTLAVGFDTGNDPQTQLPYGLILKNNASLNLEHNFTIEGNLHNNAILNFQDANAGNTLLTVENDYTSSKGNMYLDVNFNDASVSLSDKLLVRGDTSGTTTLFLNNINGLGAQTPTGDNEGILLIEIDGKSNGIFVLDQTYEINTFTYTLHKGSNGNWYLQSEEQIPSLSLVKEVNTTSITSPTTLGYTFTVVNTGNVSLTGVTLSDTLPDGTSTTPTLTSGDTNANLILDVGETWHYTLEYSVTQTQIDNGSTLVNHASVTTEQLVSAEDNASTNITQSPAISLVKEVNTTLISSPTTLGYTITVENRGNITLSNVVVSDTLGTAIRISGDTDNDGALDMDEVWVYTLEYSVTQANIDKGTDIINTASVTSTQGVSATKSAKTKISWIPAQTLLDTLLVTTYSPHQGNVSENDKKGTCKPSEAKWELVTPASHGDVTLNVDGSYAYTPDADYNGNDQFTYIITFPEPCPSSNVSTVSVKVDCATTQTSDSGAAWGGMSIFIGLLVQGLLGVTLLARERKPKDL